MLQQRPRRGKRKGTYIAYSPLKCTCESVKTCKKEPPVEVSPVRLQIWMNRCSILSQKRFFTTLQSTPLPVPPLRWRRDRLVTTSLLHTQLYIAAPGTPSHQPHPFPQRSRVGAAVRPRSCFFSQNYTSPRASTPQMYFLAELHAAGISTPSLLPWAFSRPTTLPDSTSLT